MLSAENVSRETYEKNNGRRLFIAFILFFFYEWRTDGLAIGGFPAVWNVSREAPVPFGYRIKVIVSERTYLIFTHVFLSKRHFARLPSRETENRSNESGRT